MVEIKLLTKSARKFGHDMKKILFPAVSLVAMTFSAHAATNEELLQEIKALKAENAALRAKAQPHNGKVSRHSVGVDQSSALPNFKAEPLAAPVIAPMWTGFYAGLNAGYGWGTNSGNNSNLTNMGSWNVPGNFAYDNYVVSNGAPIGGVGISSFRSNIGQSGFIGGAQFGYNYQLDKNFVVGVETDIQGTSMTGSNSATNMLGGSSAANGIDTTVYDPEYPNEPFQIYNSNSKFSTTQNTYGASTVSAGVDWLGTVRGRVGYLWSPTFLIYGTAGLAYGGVKANIATNGVINSTVNITGNAGNAGITTTQLSVAQPYFGGGHSSEILLGYTVGGGVEWMLSSNWSLKGEALYYNLGNMNVSTIAMAPSSYGSFRGYVEDVQTWQAAAGAGIVSGTTTVNYQGIIARAGVNYHFNFGAAPVVAKY